MDNHFSGAEDRQSTDSTDGYMLDGYRLRGDPYLPLGGSEESFASEALQEDETLPREDQ